MVLCSEAVWLVSLSSWNATPLFPPHKGRVMLRDSVGSERLGPVIASWQASKSVS